MTSQQLEEKIKAALNTPIERTKNAYGNVMYFKEDRGIWEDEVVAIIMALIAEERLAARIDEITYLDDHYQENSQNWERDHPGFSTAMIPMDEYLSRKKELQAQLSTKEKE